MERRIAHLDMDAFYASVELLRYPQLRGQAVVVGGKWPIAVEPNADLKEFPRLRDYAGRGVATTASYEARTQGVHSAMGLMKARVLAPDAILLPADFEAYHFYSRRFKAAVAAIVPCIESRSIDEIYIDLTHVPGETVRLAQRIKDAVREATGLSCSIGITPNKLLAKIASEMSKPDGLTVLTQTDIPTRVWPLPASKINGVGPKATLKLEGLGIRTIGELAVTPLELLVQHFGNHYGRWLSEAANGRDGRPVITVSEPKSISREITFERDLDPRRDRQTLTRILIALCERLSQDLIGKRCQGRPSASNCVMRTFARSLATKPLPARSANHKQSSVQPATASSGCRWIASFACSGSGSRHCRPWLLDTHPLRPPVKTPYRQWSGKICACSTESGIPTRPSAQKSFQHQSGDVPLWFRSAISYQQSVG